MFELIAATDLQHAAPAAITRCVVDYGLDPKYAFYYTSFNLLNRSAHSLIDVTVEYRFYDNDQTQIGRASYTYTPTDPIASQDTVPFNKNSVIVELSEGPTAVSKIACRVTGAHYTGRITWKIGIPWTGGPLKPIPNESTSDLDSSQVSAQGHDSSVPQTARAVKVDVTNAWIDHYQGHLFVHDSLVIHGAASSVTIRPSDVVLKLNLADGSHKQYDSLSNAAPVYQKFNYSTNQFALVNTVDPAEDLGRLGSVAVAAHSDVKVTVTFYVTDSPSDISATKDVSVR